jgi:hypothetical protein
MLELSLTNTMYCNQQTNIWTEYSFAVYPGLKSATETVQDIIFWQPNARKPPKGSRNVNWSFSPHWSRLTKCVRSATKMMIALNAEDNGMNRVAQSKRFTYQVGLVAERGWHENPMRESPPKRSKVGLLLSMTSSPLHVVVSPVRGAPIGKNIQQKSW